MISNTPLNDVKLNAHVKIWKAWSHISIWFTTLKFFFFGINVLLCLNFNIFSLFIYYSWRWNKMTLLKYIKNRLVVSTVHNSSSSWKNILIFFAPKYNCFFVSTQYFSNRNYSSPILFCVSIKIPKKILV